MAKLQRPKLASSDELETLVMDLYERSAHLLTAEEISRRLNPPHEDATPERVQEILDRHARRAERGWSEELETLVMDLYERSAHLLTAEEISRRLNPPHVDATPETVHEILSYRGFEF